MIIDKMLKENKPLMIIISLVLLYAMIKSVSSTSADTSAEMSAEKSAESKTQGETSDVISVQEVVSTEKEVTAEVSAEVIAVEAPSTISTFDVSTLGFPYRKLRDENMNVLPIASITGFFRDEEAKKKYYELRKAGYMVVGVTAYKTFPKQIDDPSEDKFHHSDDFNYTKELKHWLCCFNKEKMLVDSPFNPNNTLIDISESDFYDNEPVSQTEHIEKKYDFIYICNKDDDSCPLTGWNAINRNFDLAKRCFPIMFGKYKMKGLIVGRVGCGLEKEYGDLVEVTDFLDYFTLQQKMRQSKFLFVPNIYDASPRVATECLVKGVPILMNKNIVCGFKYINDFTGELFSDEHNFEQALIKLLSRLNKMDPRKWWIDNYGRSTTGKKLRNFLIEASAAEGYDEITKQLEKVKEVHFVI